MSKRLILPLPFISSTKSLRLTVTTTTTTTTFAMSSTSTQSQQQIAIDYHNRTKHSLTTGYARGPHNLDWSNQPNPFLILLPPSSPKIPLLHLPPLPKDSPPYPSLFSSPLPPQPLNLETISRFLYDSLSLSAWKSTGISTWPLRVNPSSGNLHPTESHLILPPSALSPSPLPLLAHYSPLTHSLQCRTHPPLSLFPTTSSSSSSSSSFLFLALSSILWREAWKYGERAFRYCNHDVGHAIAAISVSAAALGWDVKLLDGLGHDDLENLLGINKLYPSHQPDVLPDKPIRGKLPWVERQHPDCLLLVFPIGTEIGVDYGKMRDVIGEFAGLEWVGEPNSLSKEHVCWDVIYRTADAVKKPFTREEEEGFGVEGWRRSRLISEDLYGEFTVREVVRKRRSAVDMDGVYEMKRDVFYQILLHCLPSGEVGSGENQRRQLALPFRALMWDAEVHAALFVHKVEGLAKGLYFLVRNEEHLDGLKQAMRKDFEWVKPDGCPEGLPLYRLAKGNCERLSKHLSCHQDIASDGCFSLGMIARFESVLREKGAWMYPRLFWETGVLGQVLYLEAHAVGISATGIGCYFDDDVHEVLGLKGSEFQSLYHFTIGSPVVDKRIMSLPAYPGPGMVA